MEWLEQLFLGAFLFGLLLSVATLLLGVGSQAIHFGGHGGGTLHGLGGHAGPTFGHGPTLHAPSADLHGLPHHAGVSVHHVGDSVSPWTLTGIMAFVAWFGGVGYLALTQFRAGAWVAIVLAMLAGLLGWRLIFVVFRKLVRADQLIRLSDGLLEGTVGRVTAPIVDGRIGEIQFSSGGARHSRSARSHDGSAIPRGSEVVVVRDAEGIAYVQLWQEFMEAEVSGGTREGLA